MKADQAGEVGSGERVGPNSKVTIRYTMWLDDGTRVDSDQDIVPFTFRLGMREVFPAFEAALMNRPVGVPFRFEVEPMDAFGPLQSSLVQRFPLAAFENPECLVEGAVIQAETEEGLPVEFRVCSVEGEMVEVDFNHPLAGRRLHFEVEVLKIHK